MKKYSNMPSSEKNLNIKKYHCALVGQDNIVVIATGYRLDGPGIKAQWGENFFACPDQSWGPLTLLYNGYRVFPPGGGGAGRGLDHPPLCSAQVKERVELIPLWMFVACSGVNHCCTLIIK
jgi:hypothetical protein